MTKRLNVLPLTGNTLASLEVVLRYKKKTSRSLLMNFDFKSFSIDFVSVE